jgi:hypothetical protein
VAVEVASAISFAEPGGLFNLVRISRLIRAFIRRVPAARSGLDRLRKGDAPLRALQNGVAEFR